MNSAKTFKFFFIILFMHSYALFSQPFVSQISPKTGSTIGGTAVNIQGSGFTGANTVFFGSKPAVSFNVISDNLITAIAPPETPETINIFITTSTGTSIASKASSYTYQGFWFVYTTQFASNTIVPINTNTNIPSGSIIVGNSPSSVAITPDGTTAYVNVSGNNSTVAIDIATNTIIGLPIPVGSNPQGIAISPDGSMAYVANYGSNNVTPIDLTTNPPTPRAPIPVDVNPLSIAITPNGQFAYVVNTTSGNVTIIDLATQTPLPTTISTGGRPVAVIASPNGTRMYVTGVQFNRLREISTATNTIVRVTSLAGPGLNALTITSDATELFITNTFDASITPFDLVNNIAGPDIASDVRPDAIVLTPDQTLAYVAHEQSNNVGIVNLTLNPPVTILNIPVGNRTGDITVTPDQAPFAFFNSNLGTAGTPSTFDASDSVSPVGSIATYSWDFGDGTTIETTMPIITHTYANAGLYTVTLVVTNTAGTSLLQVFTGQTVRNNGSLNAIDVQTINIILLPPVLTNLTPNSGFTPGGNQVIITGLNFTGATAVLFGSTPASTFTVLSDTTIAATVPPGMGVVNVTVVTRFGTSAITPAAQYTYVPSIIPAPLPPTDFRGIIKKNEFLNKTEYVLKLKWKASVSANIILYRIYKNGKLIKEISAQSPLVYTPCVHSNNTHIDFEISAVDANNLESGRLKANVRR